MIKHALISTALAFFLALPAGPAWMAELPAKTPPLPINAALFSRAAGGDVRVLVRVNAGDSTRMTASASSLMNDVTFSYSQHSPRRFDAIPYLAMTIDAAGLAQLQNDPRIAGVYEDRPNEAILTDTTALIGATQSWAAGYTGAGQSIAILDTGFDTTHPMLQGKAVAEACFSSTVASSNTTSLCPNGQDQQIGAGAAINCSTAGGGNLGAGCMHGTHVAGIALGSSAVLSGVAPGASLVGVQVFSKLNNCVYGLPCLTAYDSDILQGLDQVYAWRNQHNIAAVNLSLGGGVYTTQATCDANGKPYKDMIALFNKAGIPVIFAAGNNGNPNAISMPACVTGAISAGATTKDDVVASYSNSAEFLSLLAPGSGIYSSIPGSYSAFSGTSMAAPHIAGAIAVLKSKLPSAGVMQLFEALESTGVPVIDTRAANRVKKRIALVGALNALSAPWAGNANEPDDTPALAQGITTAMTPTLRFGEPGDNDWLVMQAQAGRIYRIETRNLSDATDTILNAYAGTAASTLIATSDDVDPGIDRRSLITITATADGPLYLQIYDWDVDAFLNTRYDVLVTQVGIATPAPTTTPAP